MNYWQTKRLRLRAIEPEDAETFHRWDLDSDRARFLDFVWPPTSLAAARTFTDESSKKRLVEDSYGWVIETLDGTPVGSVQTHRCNPRDGTFQYAVDVAEEYRGNGYAGEAVWLVMRYYFDQFRYQKVTVEVHADNPSSIRLHEKLGFQREGLLRRMCYQNGQYIDVIWFGMTVEEFHTLDIGKT